MPSESFSVLVATDLSPRCDRAVDRAAQLAAHWGAPLRIIHVLDEKSARNAARQPDASEVRETLADPLMDAEILLPTGPVPATIAATAQVSGSGLIVTGVARFNALGDFVLGTAVDHIVRHAHVPVLVVKQRPRGVYRNLLFATDLSEASRTALVRAARMFPEAAIQLVHAYQVPYGPWLDTEDARGQVCEQAVLRLEAMLAHPDLTDDIRQRIRSVLDYGEVAQVVSKTLAETAADLLVLTTDGSGGILQAAIGSTALTLAARVPQDTLIMRE
ncbi:universal stress protein [Pedomonas sp. V897]|uniref:universal stress protein n=1 Tax=Pedomonas sp. V897 TaxID=3446482 RepID=UPI003EE32E23